MKKLFPSFAPPNKWRDDKQSKKLAGAEWSALRQRILVRDNYTCAYCGYRALSYQIVDHIDGDPENNAGSNLQIVCQMCNVVKHSGQGCIVQRVVDLYKHSSYNQNDAIRLTREMRSKGAKDEEIIAFLGLKETVPFKQDAEYLRPLFAFVTSRRSRQPGMYNNWLDNQQPRKYSSKRFRKYSQALENPEIREHVSRQLELLATEKGKEEKLASETSKPKASHAVGELAALYKTFSRAYEPWSEEEDEQLKREFGEGKEQKEIAATHDRQKGAIHSRLIKLGLIRV